MNRTFLNIAFFSLSVFFVKIIGAFNTFFLAKLLSPADYGVWMMLLLINSYSAIICLGTVESLVKMFPFYMGKNQIANANQVEEGVYGSIFLSSAFLFCVGLLVTFFITKPSLLESMRHIRLMLLMSSIGLFSAFYYFRMTAHQDFKKAGLIDGIRSLTTFGFMMTFSRLWGLSGTVWGYLINECIIVIISHYYCSNYSKLKPRFGYRLLLQLVKIGLPITIIWWTYMVQSSISRILSMNYLGKTATGFLGLGVNIVSVLILIPMTISRVLYPKINEELGKSRNHNLDAFVILPVKIMSIVVSLALGVLLITTPWLISNFFVKYIPGTRCTVLLLLGGFFLSLNQNGINYLIAIDKQRQILAYVLAALGLNYLLCVSFIHFGWGIDGIALGTNISTVVFTSLIWYSVFKYLQFPFRKRFLNLGMTYMPFFFSMFFVGVLQLIFHFTMETNMLRIILYVALFTLAYGSTLYLLRFSNMEYFRDVLDIGGQLKNRIITLIVRKRQNLRKPKHE